MGLSRADAQADAGETGSVCARWPAGLWYVLCSALEDTPRFKLRLTPRSHPQAVALAPVRMLLSPPLLRTYLRTLLAASASVALLLVAATAAGLFYARFVPAPRLDVDVFLGYPLGAAVDGGSGPDAAAAVPLLLPFPAGSAPVAGLLDRQPYDVALALDLPRSPRNLRAGNWMVALELWADDEEEEDAAAAAAADGMRPDGDYTGRSARLNAYSAAAAAHAAQQQQQQQQQKAARGRDRRPVATALRPALLTHRSPAAAAAHVALRLPLYALGVRTETERVELRMLSGVVFAPGPRAQRRGTAAATSAAATAVPNRVRIEVRSALERAEGASLDVCDGRVRVRFDARLAGLRYVFSLSLSLSLCHVLLLPAGPRN